MNKHKCFLHLFRAEKMQQLRIQHQQQHRARQGVYPHDQNEDVFEQRLQDDERRVSIKAF